MLAAATVTAGCAASSAGVAADARKAATFTEPVRLHAPDPWIERANGSYYMTYTNVVSVVLVRSRTLAGLHDAPATAVWNKGHNLWAPELHRLNGRWYIYYSAGDDTTHMQVRVLEGGTGADPLSTPYTDKGAITPPGQWSIDATVLQVPHQKSPYLVWSGHSGIQQVLKIAKMASPWRLAGRPVTISQPTHAWETQGLPINEGPEPLVHNGKVFLTFSASGCWTDSYSLGLLTLTGADPLKAAAWRKSATPVFRSGSGAYATGHNGFFTSPDGKESWIAYHAVDFKGGNACTQERSSRAQPFTWSRNGTPNFGVPAKTGVALPAPSGEKP